MTEIANTRVFSALIEENAKLRSEITEINKYQFKITTTVSLGVVGGFGAWIAFLKNYPIILVFLAGLSLIQILTSLEFRLSIKALSHRLKLIELQIRDLCENDHVMLWESRYVEHMFGIDFKTLKDVTIWKRPFKLLTLLAKLAFHATFIFPLIIIYFLCITMPFILNLEIENLQAWTVFGIFCFCGIFCIYILGTFGFSKKLDFYEKIIRNSLKHNVSKYES